MLRPSFARKIVRLRTARLLARSYQTPLPTTTLNPYTPPVETQLPAQRGLYVPEPTQAHDTDHVDQYNTSLEELKTRLSERADIDAPELDELALRSFYYDLISSSVEESKEIDDAERPLLEAPRGRKMIDKATRIKLVHGLAKRLEQSALDRVTGTAGDDSASEQFGGLVVSERDEQAAWKVADFLGQINLSSTSKPTFSLKGKEKDVVRPDEIPTGVASQREWDALFDSFIAAKDAKAAESLLAVMLQHGVRPDERQIDSVMKVYARAGGTEEIARMTATLLSAGVPMSESHQQAFITALITPDPPQITSAITYLREFEKLGIPLPQSSYNLVLSRLTTPTPTYHTNAHTRAEAWDLFYHMRLQAHPTPSRQVYTTMLRTCGDARDPQPERARDLWIAMTEEGEKVQPQRYEYDAIIKALGSTKKDYLEAFELLRQMLAKHYDATIAPFEDEPKTLWSPYVPTVKTFTSLMEGTKRAGDLERARWILSELVGLVRSSVALGGQIMDGPNEELMTGIFMAYAAWKPQLVRSNVKKLKETEEAGANVEPQAGQQEGEDVEAEEAPLEAKNLEELASTSNALESDPNDRSSSSSSAPTIPRTAAEALREADGLFARIIADAASHDKNIFAHPFCDVNLNTRLVNSYLSAHFAHSFAASRKDIRQVWERTWQTISAIRPDVKPNGWTYMMLLEFGARSRKNGESKEERAQRLQWSREVWGEYRQWADSSSTRGNEGSLVTPNADLVKGAGDVTGTLVEASTSTDISSSPPIPSAMEQRTKWLQGLGERQIEKCWKFGIRSYILSGDLTSALDLLREFHALYPPKGILETYAPNLPSDLLHFSDITSIAEPNVPPHLLFEDIDVLHKALIAKHDVKTLKEVDFIVKDYATHLKKRRHWRISGRGIGPALRKIEREAIKARPKALKAPKESTSESTYKSARDTRHSGSEGGFHAFSEQGDRDNEHENEREEGDWDGIVGHMDTTPIRWSRQDGSANAGSIGEETWQRSNERNEYDERHEHNRHITRGSRSQAAYDGQSSGNAENGSQHRSFQTYLEEGYLNSRARRGRGEIGARKSWADQMAR